MAKKASKKRQHGDSHRQKVRCSLDVRQSAPRSATPSSSRIIHADAFLSNSPHKSFKRTYREDYVRDLKVPGMGQHIYESFAMIFQHFKLFGGLLVISTVMMVLAMAGFTETTAVFAVLIFLMICEVSDDLMQKNS